MDGKKIKTPEKIIDATIDCIERNGFDSLTVRMIAEAAGVNIAAVNYHFHSKENLVEQVKSISFNHMLEDLRDISVMPDKTARETIRDMCKYMLEGGAKFPQITRMHFYEAFIRNNVEVDTYKSLNSVLDDVADRISKANRIERKDINISLHRLFATLFFVSIFPNFFSEFTGYSLKDDSEARDAFLEDMINTLPF